MPIKKVPPIKKMTPQCKMEAFSMQFSNERMNKEINKMAPTDTAMIKYDYFMKIFTLVKSRKKLKIEGD